MGGLGTCGEVLELRGNVAYCDEDGPITAARRLTLEAAEVRRILAEDNYGPGSGSSRFLIDAGGSVMDAPTNAVRDATSSGYGHSTGSDREAVSAPAKAAGHCAPLPCQLSLLLPQVSSRHVLGPYTT